MHRLTRDVVESYITNRQPQRIILRIQAVDRHFGKPVFRPTCRVKPKPQIPRLPQEVSRRGIKGGEKEEVTLVIGPRKHIRCGYRVTHLKETRSRESITCREVDDNPVAASKSKIHNIETNRKDWIQNERSGKCKVCRTVKIQIQIIRFNVRRIERHAHRTSNKVSQHGLA